MSASPTSDSELPNDRPSSEPPPHAAARAIGKRPRMSRFRRILLAITAATHAPFVVAVADAALRLGAKPALAWALGLALGALMVWLFNGRAEHIANDAPRSAREVFLFDYPYYVHWSACIFCLVPSVVYLAAAPLVDVVRGAPVALSSSFFFWTYLAGLVVCGYGVTLRRWFFVTRRVEIPVRGLAASFDGYRIAHLSDLHIGAMTPPWWARRWVARSNGESPDAVVITGDLVTSGVAFHESIASVLGELRAKDGVYVSMGNHDYFGEGEPLISLINAAGPRVLRNEGVVLARGESRVFLTAIDDTWTKRADIDKALAERPAGTPTIMLAHDPDKFPQLAKRGVALVLSGHTHGGQIAFPFLGRWINASKLAHRFHLGAYQEGDATLYVHPGLGTTGPPIRVGVAPAVVLITLRAA